RGAERARHELARDLAAWAAQPRRTAERRLRLVFGLERRAGAAALTLQARLTTPRLIDVPRTATHLQQLRSELRADPALLPSVPGSSLGLADGQFSAVAVEPPPRILERFQAAEGLPLPPAERAGVLGRLAPRFPHLRDILEAHTRVRPVDIAITLDLRDDDW